jgi:F-type H+/Na+-transporting ATPase subunit alpha
MVELLKQGQYGPLPVERQIAIIFSGTQGLLDDLPVHSVRAFEEYLYAFMDRSHAQVMSDIASKKELADETREVLTQAIGQAKAEFMARQGIKAA